MPFGLVGWVGLKQPYCTCTVYIIGSRYPCRKKGQFYRKETAQWNAYYRKNVTLWCVCSILTTEWLDSSVLGIPHLVTHTGGESILCREEWRGCSSQITSEFLIIILHYVNALWQCYQQLLILTFCWFLLVKYCCNTGTVILVENLLRIIMSMFCCKCCLQKDLDVFTKVLCPKHILPSQFSLPGNKHTKLASNISIQKQLNKE